MSYKVSVHTTADDKGVFTDNELRFATVAEAEEYARDLYRRWVLVDEYRIEESEDPVKHEWVDGVLRSTRHFFHLNEEYDTWQCSKCNKFIKISDTPPTKEEMRCSL